MAPIATLALLLPLLAAAMPMDPVQKAARDHNGGKMYIRGKRDPFMRQPGAVKRDVDTRYPYTGPAIPIGDYADQTVNGNGKGFERLLEPPAVWPSDPNPTNNINTINLAYVPNGMNVHFSTPFGIDGEPCVNYGTSPSDLSTNVKGQTTTYDRTPPCSAYDQVTLCSQFFHNVQITGLEPGTTYYYQIPGGNGTTPSNVHSFTTAVAAGTDVPFSVAVVNDMGYTNAKGTHQQLIEAVDTGVSFVWHGGDISYADDWYEGFLPCVLTGPDAWPLCYNGSSTTAPPGDDEDYYQPLPASEIPNQGGPEGGDFSTMYETNWDLWQNWMNPITSRVPYMTNPGNHEAACAEFDGPNNELTAYLVDNEINGTAVNSSLTYYSCPESQRNFTAYQHRFRMPGDDTGGRSNFWYSFDYGSAHFISFSGETDFYQSPEYPFIAETGGNSTEPTEDETYITDSGPFGYIDGSYKNNSNYEQVQWMKQDLASVDRTKTPWVFAMSHRPLYASETSSYQAHLRNAFEDLFLEYKVDAYFAGHIHYYERTLPLGKNATICPDNVISNHSYITGNGNAIPYLVNGQAGNVESHSSLVIDQLPQLPFSVHLDQEHYGFSRLNIFNSSVAQWEFIRGDDGQQHDYVYFYKPGN